MISEPTNSAFVPPSKRGFQVCAYDPNLTTHASVVYICDITHAATHCTTLYHTATHCNSFTNSNTNTRKYSYSQLQHVVALQRFFFWRIFLQHIAIHCNYSTNANANTCKHSNFKQFPGLQHLFGEFSCKPVCCTGAGISSVSSNCVVADSAGTVAVCCIVLQCVAVRCRVLQSFQSLSSQIVLALLQCVAVCCRVLQCVAVCCRVLQCVAESSKCVFADSTGAVVKCCSVLHCSALCCSV